MIRAVRVIAGRVARHAWTHGRIVEDVCVGLARRGWGVSLITHSIDDPRPLLDAGVSIAAKHDFVSHGTHFPSARSYSRWVREQLAVHTPAVCGVAAHTLVLTRLVDGRHLGTRAAAHSSALICPLEPDPRDWWNAMLATRGVLGLATSLVRERGVCAHLVASAAHRDNDASSSAAGLLTYAPLSARGIDQGAASEHRRAARLALGLGPGKWAVLVSCVEPAPLGIERALCALLRTASALAAHARRHLSLDARSPVVLVLSHQPFHVHARELRARVDEAGWNALGQGVRLLGSTEHMSAALAACDAVALLPRAGQTGSLSRAAEHYQTRPHASRLACDARWLGIPVLGSRERAGNLDSPGSTAAARPDSLDPTITPRSTQSLLVDDAALTVDESWLRLLTDARAATAPGAAEGSVGVSTPAAAVEGHRSLHVDAMIERVERALGALSH